MLHILLRLWIASCHETADQLSDYVDGELEGRTLARARRHLSRCVRCRALLGSLRDLLEQLQALRAPQQIAPKPLTAAAVLARIRHPDAGP